MPFDLIGSSVGVGMGLAAPVQKFLPCMAELVPWISPPVAPPINAPVPAPIKPFPNPCPKLPYPATYFLPPMQSR